MTPRLTRDGPIRSRNFIAGRWTGAGPDLAAQFDFGVDATLQAAGASAH